MNSAGPRFSPRSPASRHGSVKRSSGRSKWSSTPQPTRRYSSLRGPGTGPAKQRIPPLPAPAIHFQGNQGKTMDDSSGWICLHRTLIEHELWNEEKFTRGQAWVDLLLLANHKPGAFRARGVSVKVDRGQVGKSEVSLAERWHWSRTKVRRFLSELETIQ